MSLFSSLDQESSAESKGEIARLLSRHIDLARLELQLEVQEAFRRCRLFLMAVLLFLVGFCFLQIAILMGLVHIGVPAWAASILLGLLYIVGAVFLVVRLSRRNPSLGRAFEGTQQELERSLEWISKRFF